jgi:hypothetical protein
MKEQHPAIVSAIKRDEIVKDVDGYFYWWPSKPGYVDAAALRAIAAHLDKINADWDKQVREGLALANQHLGEPENAY